MLFASFESYAFNKFIECYLCSPMRDNRRCASSYMCPSAIIEVGDNITLDTEPVELQISSKRESLIGIVMGFQICFLLLMLNHRNRIELCSAWIVERLWERPDQKSDNGGVNTWQVCNHSACICRSLDVPRSNPMGKMILSE